MSEGITETTKTSNPKTETEGMADRTGSERADLHRTD